jgi:hypothetical protein
MADKKYEPGLSESHIADVFTEWMRQYNEDPAAFDERHHFDDTADYGSRAAKTFLHGFPT